LFATGDVFSDELFCDEKFLKNSSSRFDKCCSFPASSSAKWK